MPNLIEIVISGKNEAKKAIAEAKADSEGLSGTMSKMGAASGLILAGIGIEAGKMATSYELSTTRLVTSAGESTKNLDMVRKGMLTMAGQVGVGAEELSKGMYTVESAGYHAGDGLTVLKAAAQGAKDENADLGKVANAVTDVLVDYHLKATDAANVTSQMVTAVSYGKTSFDDFSGSMHNILPLASAMHLSFADVSGVLAEMTAHGMSADQASQNMANAMRSLIAPTKAQQKEFAALGISAAEVRDKLGTVGLSGTMQFLEETAKKVSPNVLEQEAALKKLMGTAPGLSVALMTTGENAEATAAAIKGIGGSAADAQGNVKGFSEIQETLAQKVAQAKASFDSLMITLGNKIIPVVKDVTDWMNKHHDIVVKVGEALVVLMGVLAAYAIGTKVAAVATALFEGATWLLNAALDANPIVLIVLALAALAAALYEILTHWKTVWAEVKKIADDVGKFLSRIWRDVEDEAKRIWADITGALREAWDALADLWDSTGGKVVAKISQAWDEVSSAVSQEWDHIAADLSSIWDNLVRLWNDTGAKLIAVIGSVMDFIGNHILEPAWNLITKMLGDYMKIVEGVLRAGWDIVRGVFQLAWDAIVGIVKAAWDLIGAAVSTAVDFIEAILKTGWDVVLAAVHIAWDLIKAAINVPLDLIKGALQLFTDSVTGHWSKLWTDVKKLASDLWNNIYALISGVLGTIKTLVVNSAKNIWDGFTNGISAALAGIGKALGDIWLTITGFFKDAGKWLWQAGKNIIQGLINGIGSMASDLGSALGNVAGKVGSILNPVNWFAHGGEVGAAATGGDRSGLVMVGEQGPELVRLPTGSTVRSHPDTMAALSGGGGRGGAPAQLEWVGPEGDELFTLIKRWIRVNYGSGPDSVQTALGQ